MSHVPTVLIVAGLLISLHRKILGNISKLRRNCITTWKQIKNESKTENMNLPNTTSAPETTGQNYLIIFGKIKTNLQILTFVTKRLSTKSREELFNSELRQVTENKKSIPYRNLSKSLPIFATFRFLEIDYLIFDVISCQDVSPIVEENIGYDLICVDT